MLAKVIEEFDTVLRTQHPALHASLQPGVSPTFWLPGPIGAWFAWRNGQPSDESPQFLDAYRFVPIAEAREQVRQARMCLFSSPIQGIALAVFARRMLYSWPLLVDVAGDGYFYSTISRRVFYKCEGEQDIVFPSFVRFVECLIELATLTEQSGITRYEREFEVIDAYAR